MTSKKFIVFLLLLSLPIFSLSQTLKVQQISTPYGKFGYVPENGKELAKNLGVELSFVPNSGHFNKKAGYIKFEQLWNKLEKIS